jgi:hypothetical protein
MDEYTFRSTASVAVADLSVDTDRVIAGVYRRARRRRTGVAVGSLAGVVLLSGVSAVGVTALSDQPSDRVPVAAPPVSSGVELPAYQMANVAADVVVSVGGVDLTYLPAGTSAEPARREVTPMFERDGTHEVACFLDDCEEGIAVRVSRGTGLGLEAYLEDHFLGESRSTTVAGRPALATNLSFDDQEAAGLVWSPRDGLIVQLTVPTDQRTELRRIVEGMWIPGS